MTSTHRVVVWLDHHRATVLLLHGEQVESRTIEAAIHPTRQHHSEVRTGHEFFGHVCDALESAMVVLVTGSHLALDDFRRYVHKHRPRLDPSIAGWVTVDHPSEGQLLALARRFFVDHDRMAGL